MVAGRTSVRTTPNPMERKALKIAAAMDGESVSQLVSLTIRAYLQAYHADLLYKPSNPPTPGSRK
jgi:hypothetical protein